MKDMGLRASGLGTVAALLFVLVLAAANATAANAAMEPDPDTTAAVGLTFKDPDIAQAVEDFEGGKTQESIDRLMAIVRDPAARDQKRNQELRVAASMLKIRSGDVKQLAEGRSILMRYQANETEDIARRAQVLRLASEAKVKDGTPSAADLKPRANWHEYLRHVKRYLEIRIGEEHERLDRCVKNETWGGLREVLINTRNFVAQHETIKLTLDEERDIVTIQGRRLAGAARDLNGVISDHVDRAEAYRAEIPRMAERARPGKRAQVNAELRKARDARKVGEEIIKEHRDLRDRYGRRVEPMSVVMRDVPRDAR